MNLKGSSMRKVLLCVLLICIPLFAYDFKVTIKYDEMAVAGEAEGILQYYANGNLIIEALTLWVKIL